MEETAYWDTAQEVMEEYDPDPDHARQVTRLAMRLFDQIRRFTDVTDQEPGSGDGIDAGASSRHLLKLAAMLHDIGWSAPGSRGHHKKSRDMIMDLEFPGLDHTDQILVAQIARYHRKNHPDPTLHPDFNALDPPDQERVRWLAAILRIADGLDRSHQAEVNDLTCRITESEIRITVECNAQSRSSVLYGANLKKQLMEEVSGLPVVLTAVGAHPGD